MKKLGIDELIGYTIKSYTKEGTIVTEEGEIFEIHLEDDGCGGNDSHAFFEKFDLDNIIGEKILEIHEEGGTNVDGAVFTLKTKMAMGIIEIVHESNGYYGWGYEVVIK